MYWNDRYQPFPMTLCTIQIQCLNSNRLSLQPTLEIIMNEPFVDLSEPAFANIITPGEVLGNDLKVLESENMKVETKGV